MAGEESEIPRPTEAARQKRLSEDERAQTRVNAMVTAFHQMIIGHDRIVCIMAIYTLAAHWIYHMRPEIVPEDVAVDMVMRGIIDTLNKLRKDGIEPGEIDTGNVITVKFTN